MNRCLSQLSRETVGLHEYQHNTLSDDLRHRVKYSISGYSKEPQGYRMSSQVLCWRMRDNIETMSTATGIQILLVFFFLFTSLLTHIENYDPVSRACKTFASIFLSSEHKLHFHPEDSDPETTWRIDLNPS